MQLHREKTGGGPGRLRKGVRDASGSALTDRRDGFCCFFVADVCHFSELEPPLGKLHSCVMASWVAS